MDYRKLVGKEIYLIPTGNMISRNNGGALSQVKKARVKKKSRVFVTLSVEQKDSSSCDQKLRVNEYKPENLILDGFNGGYQVFECKARLDEHIRAVKTRSKLISSMQSLTDKELCTIANAMGW